MLKPPARLSTLVPPGLRKQRKEPLRSIRSLRAYRTPLSQDQKRKLALWQRRTVALLSQAFGEDSDQAAEIDEIEFEPTTIFGINVGPTEATYRDGLDTAEAVLKTALDVELSPTASPIHGRPAKAFVSASFDPEADVVVKWFCDMSRAVGFE